MGSNLVVMADLRARAVACESKFVVRCEDDKEEKTKQADQTRDSVQPWQKGSKPCVEDGGRKSPASVWVVAIRQRKKEKKKREREREREHVG